MGPVMSTYTRALRLRGTHYLQYRVGARIAVG
jgi:hypothetical protein